MGRRKLLIGGSLACSITLAMCMATASQSGVPLNSRLPSMNLAASRANVASWVLLMVAFNVSYQPLLPTYPSECLSTDQRSSGMSVNAFVVSLFSKSYIRAGETAKV